MADKTYKSSLFKRIIDLGLVREAEVDDLVRIWRVGTGDEKAITLQNFVKTVDTDLGNGEFPISEIVEQVVGELEALTNGYRLISGGIVQWTGTGFVFFVSQANYVIASVPYTALSTTKTLSAPDPTNNRIDVFAVNTSGQVIVIEGTPSASPVKPQIDPATELELTSIIVEAGTTIPTVTDESIYAENVEWTGTSSGTGTANFASTADPFDGTVSVELTNIQNGFKVVFDNGADLDILTYTTFGLLLKLKATLGGGQDIDIRFLNSANNAVCNSQRLVLNKANTTTYQFIGIDLDTFTFVNNTFRKLEITYVRTTGGQTFTGLFLDNIKLQAGVVQPPIGVLTFLGLSDVFAPSGYVGQAGKVVVVRSDELGLEFVTGGGGAGGVEGVTGTGVDNTDPANPVISQSPYDLTQEGAVDADVLTWVAANSRYEPVAPSGGGGISGLTTNKIPKATSATTIGDSIITEYNTGSSGLLFGNNTSLATATPLNISSGGTFGNNTVGSSGNLKWTMFTDGNPINAYGIGMSFNLMEIRSGFNAGIGFFTNNGIEAMNIDVNQLVRIGGASITSLEKLKVTGSVYIGSTVNSTTISSLNLGLSFGVGAGGSSGNLKFILYGTGVNSYGIGMSASLMEFRAGSGAAIGFFPNNGVESMRILSTGVLQFANAKDISFNATTGTKIGTATNQKLAFWNKTPIIQPTTGITGATRVGGGGTALTSTDTFGGYTVAQLAAILINTGLTA